MVVCWVVCVKVCPPSVDRDSQTSYSHRGWLCKTFQTECTTGVAELVETMLSIHQLQMFSLTICEHWIVSWLGQRGREGVPCTYTLLFYLEFLKGISLFTVLVFSWYTPICAGGRSGQAVDMGNNNSLWKDNLKSPFMRWLQHRWLADRLPAFSRLPAVFNRRVEGRVPANNHWWTNNLGDLETGQVENWLENKKQIVFGRTCMEGLWIRFHSFEKG